MDRQLLKACSKGDLSLCNHLIIADPDILLSTTPHKNNCLDIAAMLGHHEFAKEVWSRAHSLFSGTNIDGETPLIASLMVANLSLASDIITAATQYMQHDDLEEGRPLNLMLLKVDRRHAMRNGFENLALWVLDQCIWQPAEDILELSRVSKTRESPMYMAARRGYSRVVERLLETPSSADCGPHDDSAIDAAVAAVKFDHSGLPIFARKAAFLVFLISDTIAMCSSLAVAFLCILTTWEDLDILLNYRKTTRALMWCAYEATAVAFGTGLFTVIAPNNFWLAIIILVICTILPLLSKIIGDWPLLMVRYRLGGLFRKDLIPNI